MKDLTITEIEAYLNLSYKRVEKLARSLTMYPADQDMHNDYEKTYKIIEALEEEAKTRLDKLIQ